MTEGPRRSRPPAARRQPSRRRRAAAREVSGERKLLGWPKICKLARASLWEHSDKRLKLAQLLGQLGGFLTLGSSLSRASSIAAAPTPAAAARVRSSSGRRPPTARAGSRRFGQSSALRAHTNAASVMPNGDAAVVCPREQQIGNPWASSYAPPYRSYSVF